MRRTGTLVGALLGSLIIGATPAVAGPIGVGVESATLIQRGVAVALEFSVTCDDGWTGSLGVSIAQAQGSKVVRGDGGTQLTCTGEEQTVVVEAMTYSRTFRQGSAYVQYSGFVCNPDFFLCERTSGSATVQIVR